MKKYELKKPIKSNDGSILKHLDLKEEEDVSGAELFSKMNIENPQDTSGVIAYLTGLSTKEVYQIKPCDYVGLVEHQGNLIQGD